MPRGAAFYVNGINETIQDSISRMKRFHARYVSVAADAADSLFADRLIDVNAMSIPEIREAVKARMRPRLDPRRAGRLPIFCRDRKVRYYDPESWATTIARSRSRDLQEAGLHNEMVKAGFDLVIVSGGRVRHEGCRVWEGRVISVSGKTPGYPTVDQLRSSGEIFHPRCVHTTSPLLLAEDEAGPRLWGRDTLPNAVQKQIREASDWAIFPTKGRRPQISGDPPEGTQGWDRVRDLVAEDLADIPDELYSLARNEPLIDVLKVPAQEHVDRMILAAVNHAVRIRWPGAISHNSVIAASRRLHQVDTVNRLVRRIIDEHGPDDWGAQFKAAMVRRDATYRLLGVDPSKLTHLFDDFADARYAADALSEGDRFGAAKAIARIGYEDLDDLDFVGDASRRELADRLENIDVREVRPPSITDREWAMYLELSEQRGEFAELQRLMKEREAEIERLRKRFDELKAAGRSEEARQAFLKIQEVDMRGFDASSRFREYGLVFKRVIEAQDRETYGLVTREMLSEFREFGPRRHHTFAKGTRKTARARIEEAEEWFPSDWLDRSVELGELAVSERRGARASYTPVNRRILLHTSRDVDGPEIAIHEMAHRMEDAVPRIRRLEQRYYQRQTAGDEGFVRDGGLVRLDDFPTWYVGKEYPSIGFYEILSMGVQSIYTRGSVPGAFWQHRDHFENFILGLLAGG